jgi:hypothetical protein
MEKIQKDFINDIRGANDGGDALVNLELLFSFKLESLLYLNDWNESLEMLQVGYSIHRSAS